MSSEWTSIGESGTNRRPVQFSVPSLASETGMYVGSGIFAALVYLTGVVTLTRATGVDLASRHFALFSLGFWQFVACYYLALWLYSRFDR